MESELKEMLASLDRTGYCQWMKSEGVPIVEGFSVADIRELKLGLWRRMGGSGAFVHLYGMEGQTGMYVAEIPSGGALNPERHLYEEMICILAGHGATEIWQDGGEPRLFEWGPFSLFAPPLNSWHRLVNGGREPVRLMAVTTAPIAMDFYRNAKFIFNCPYTFTDRFQGEDDYFATSQNFYAVGLQSIWETNFIPDAKEVKVRDDLHVKGTEVGMVQFESSKNGLIGHVADWPTGLYHKAHYHGAGAVIVILKSEGYTLLWPKESGTQPYATGHGDEVVELYVRHVAASAPVPIRSLEGFKRIHLKPGQTETVSFTLTPRQLSLIDDQARRLVEPGEIEVQIGGGQIGARVSSSHVLKAKLRITGEVFTVK